jgi:hypothetical protein
VSARIEVGSVASKEMGVARVSAAPGEVLLTTTRQAQQMTPVLARGLAQLLNAAADRAEGVRVVFRSSDVRVKVEVDGVAQDHDGQCSRIVHHGECDCGAVRQ